MHFIIKDQFSPFLVHGRLWGLDVGIRWYGLAYLFGFVAMYLFFRKAANRSEVEGFRPEHLDNLALRIIVGVLVGGRVGFVVQHPETLLHHPLFLISIWNGGMAYFGGLAGAILAIWSFAWQYRISFLAMTDVCAMPAALALGVGRIANFVNGELYGKPTFSNWGVIFQKTGGGPLPRHPSQLYECVSHLVLFAILVFAYRRWHGKIRPGAVSFVYLIGYGLFRVITDFYRQDDVYWGPLSDGQWFSLGVALAGAISLYFNQRRRLEAPTPPSP